MNRFLLVRHGETDWNKDRRIMGRDPIGLNETGRAQSRRLHAALQCLKIDRVYSSPVLRAEQTARILCEGTGLQPSFHPLLVEVDYGEWVGRTFASIRETSGYVPYFERLDTPVAPGGETLHQVRDRGLKFLEEVKGMHPEEAVMVVTHADWIKCLLMHFLAVPFENIWRLRIDNATASLIESENRGFRVLTVNHGDSLEHLFADRISF